MCDLECHNSTWMKLNARVERSSEVRALSHLTCCAVETNSSRKSDWKRSLNVAKLAIYSLTPDCANIYCNAWWRTLFNKTVSSCFLKFSAVTRMQSVSAFSPRIQPLPTQFERRNKSFDSTKDVWTVPGQNRKHAAGLLLNLLWYAQIPNRIPVVYVSRRGWRSSMHTS